MVVYYLSGSYYKVRVYGDDGKPISGAIVKIIVNKRAYNVKSSANGYAAFKISLAPNTYLITATYNGYKVSNKIVVKPLLTAKNIIKKKTKVTRFSAKVVDTKGKAVRFKYITFKINGKAKYARTNSLGVATISLVNLNVGKYIVTTTFGKSTIRNTIFIRK